MDLGREPAERGEIAQRPATDDRHMGLGERCQGSKRHRRFARGQCGHGVGDDGGDGSVVVTGDQKLLALRQFLYGVEQAIEVVGGLGVVTTHCCTVAALGTELAMFLTSAILLCGEGNSGSGAATAHICGGRGARL